ncbi:MAG: hypothetical protein LCH69_15255 [Proteobacteria bacterium]|nr:hypothetical protein [Pseudomonadota bacterium]
MSVIRPEMQRHIRRWAEVAMAVAVALAGGALMRAGGYLLFPAGALLTLLALGWGLTALRRMSFQREVSAPGLVEVVEGQVGYFGPSFGGFIALADLTELRLAEFHGTQQWRLKTAAGEVLLIPTEASGADKLFDAFATLPGIDMAALAAALDNRTATLPLWRRPVPRLKA